jgi:hypothetical protein
VYSSKCRNIFSPLLGPWHEPGHTKVKYLGILHFVLRRRHIGLKYCMYVTLKCLFSVHFRPLRCYGGKWLMSGPCNVYRDTLRGTHWLGNFNECFTLPAACLVYLLFIPEDGGSTSAPTAGKLLPHSTMSHATRHSHAVRTSHLT